MGNHGAGECDVAFPVCHGDHRGVTVTEQVNVRSGYAERLIDFELFGDPFGIGAVANIQVRFIVDRLPVFAVRSFLAVKLDLEILEFQLERLQVFSFEPLPGGELVVGDQRVREPLPLHDDALPVVSEQATYRHGDQHADQRDVEREVAPFA